MRPKLLRSSGSAGSSGSSRLQLRVMFDISGPDERVQRLEAMVWVAVAPVQPADLVQFEPDGPVWQVLEICPGTLRRSPGERVPAAEDRRAVWGGIVGRSATSAVA